MKTIYIYEFTLQTFFPPQILQPLFGLASGILWYNIKTQGYIFILKKHLKLLIHFSTHISCTELFFPLPMDKLSNLN